MNARIVLAATLTAALSHLAPAQKVFVDASAPGPHTGATWTQAFLTVQEGIDAGALGAGMTGTAWDVLVAEGTYFPTTDFYLGGTPRHRTIRLKEGANLRGGFLGWNGGAGGTSEDPAAPDGGFNKTVLSGANDVSFHVVVADQMNVFQVFPYIVDGFKVTAGRADDTSFPHDSGAGILIRRQAKVNLENVTVRDNVAVADGGGTWVGETHNEGYLRCKKSRFRGNIAVRGAGLFVNDNTIEVSLCNVRFRDNGNQLQDATGWPPITNKGGAIYMGREVLGESANLLIHDNFAYHGGGIFHQPSEVQGSVIDYWFRHCTITQNVSPVVPPTLAGAGIEIAPGKPGSATPGTNGNRLYLDNSILYGNGTGADIHYSGDMVNPGIHVFVRSSCRRTINIVSPSPSYSEDAFTITLPPVFANPAGNNFHLSNNIANLSNCIDRAATALIGPDFLDIDENGVFEPVLPLDFDLFGRVFDQAFGSPGFEVDMGAYEVSGLISQ